MTGSYDGTAHVWDLQTGESIVLPAGRAGSGPGFGGSGERHPWALNVVALSPGGRWVLTGDTRMTAFMWDLRDEVPAGTGQLLAKREKFSYNFESIIELPWMTFSPNGRLAVTGTGDKDAQLWDMTAQIPSENPVVLKGHGNRIDQVAFSQDNRWLATGSWDRTARLWDLTADDPSAEPFVLRQKSSVEALAFSADGRWLATTTREFVYLWNLKTSPPAAKPIVLYGHRLAVIKAAGSPNGRWIATADRDKVVRLWDLDADPPGSSSRIISHGEQVVALAFTVDNRLVLGTESGLIHIWKTDSASLPPPQ